MELLILCLKLHYILICLPKVINLFFWSFPDEADDDLVKVCSLGPIAFNLLSEYNYEHVSDALTIVISIILPGMALFKARKLKKILVSSPTYNLDRE